MKPDQARCWRIRVFLDGTTFTLDTFDQAMIGPWLCQLVATWPLGHVSELRMEVR